MYNILLYVVSLFNHLCKELTELTLLTTPIKPEDENDAYSTGFCFTVVFVCTVFAYMFCHGIRVILIII